MGLLLDRANIVARMLGLPNGQYFLSYSQNQNDVFLKGTATYNDCKCTIEVGISTEPEYDFNLNVLSCEASFDAELDYFCSTIGKEAITSRIETPDKEKSQRILSAIFDKEKFGVILIDAYDHPSGTSFNQADEVNNMASVLARANKLDIPVFEVITKNDFGEDTNEKLARLRDDSWIKIEKIKNDSFAGTELAKLLQNFGITSVVVMGFNQLYCVKQTVESALDLGFTVYTSFDVIQGTVSDNPSYNHEVEYLYEVSQRYYRNNTVLVDGYDQLPIMID